MKDAVITVRVPGATRQRIEELAKQEGRSLSQQVERLIERGMASGGLAAGTRGGPRKLSGLLAGGAVPTIEDFHEVRAVVSEGLNRRTRPHAERRR